MRRIRVFVSLLLLLSFLPVQVFAQDITSEIDQLFDQLDRQLTSLERSLRLSKEELINLKLDLANLELWCQMLLETSADLSIEYTDTLMILSTRVTTLEQRLTASEKRGKNWERLAAVLGGCLVASIVVNIVQGVSN
jgi:septal ring factor EnvC (AmiA/AmiB activator)